MQSNISYNQVKRIHCSLASKSLWHYCKVRNPKFYNENAPYLMEMCEAIQEFENDDNELLIINMPPRHGKSYTASNATRWLLGREPLYKIATCSYNKMLSTKFSRQVRDGISEIKRNQKIVFKDIFPKVKIKQGNSSITMWALNGNEEENYLATSPGGTFTGIGADFIVIDDLVKNAYEAYNQIILENHWEWFTDTLYSRLQGKRKILVFMTRWATKDLAGRLIEMFNEQGRKYRLISKKAYNDGIMLNNNVLNLEQYQNLIQTIGEDIVNANYNQEPVDIKGKLYSTFKTYEETEIKGYSPKIQFIRIYAHCDTADEGDNYLCNIIWGKTRDNKVYILDIYYTQDAMEITEKEVARRLTEHKVAIFRPESNNGGRGFARAVIKEYEALGNTTTITKWYHQTLNKEARILSESTNVMNNVYMPSDWKQRFPLFYKHINEYQRSGKNLFDDAPDTLTAVVEELQKRGLEFA